MRTRRQRIGRTLVLMAAVTTAAACSREPRPVSHPPAASTADPKAVVAEVDGKPITRAELDGKAAQALVALRQQEYDTLSQALDQMITDRLMEKEAAARHLSREALLKAEVDDRVPAPDAAKVSTVYEQNKERFRGQKLEQMAPDITRAIHQQ